MFTESNSRLISYGFPGTDIKLHLSTVLFEAMQSLMASEVVPACTFTPGALAIMFDIPRAFICLYGASGDQHSVHLIVVANDVKPANPAKNRSKSIHIVLEPNWLVWILIQGRSRDSLVQLTLTLLDSADSKI